MNKSIELFLQDVCSHILFKGVHHEIKEELSLHIEEATKFYIEQGYPEEEAIQKALAGMGNPTEIGEKLNEQHKPQTEWCLIVLAALVSLFGIFLMYTSSHFDNHPISFMKHLVHVAVGILTFLPIYFFNYTGLKKYPIPLFFSAMFLLVYCACFGTAHNGVRSFIAVGSLAVSVNAVASIGFILAFCGFMEKYYGTGCIGIFKMLLWGAASIIPFMLLPSMSTAFSLFVVYAVILLLAVARKHFAGNSKMQMVSLLVLGGSGILMTGLILLIGSPYRLQRMLMFWNNTDPSGSGWIYAMAGKVLTAAKLIGKAEPLAEGSIDWVMPEITTDFALINLIHNFGWLAGLLLIILVTLFIVRMFIVSGKIKNSFGFYLSFAACTMLTFQFVVNILMNLGLFPYLAVTLPFISYGGSNYVTNVVYVALIASIWRRNNLTRNTQKPVPPKDKIIYFRDNKLIIDFKKKCKL